MSHDVLLGRLETNLGLRGTALNWFRSYLTDRRQRVSIGGVFSEPPVIRMGVPQGLVLGPQLFSIYTRPLGGIIRSHGLAYDFYADDLQMFIFVEPVQALVDGAMDRF